MLKGRELSGHKRSTADVVGFFCFLISVKLVGKCLLYTIFQSVLVPAPQIFMLHKQKCPVPFPLTKWRSGGASGTEHLRNLNGWMSGRTKHSISRKKIHGVS